MWPKGFDEVFKNLPNREINIVEEKLIPELSGILNCSLAAIARVFKRNGVFSKTTSGDIAKGEWELEANQVLRFLDDECVKDSKSSVASGELFARYRNWVEVNHIQRPMSNTSAFARKVRNAWGLPKAVGSDRSSKARGIRGLCFKGQRPYDDIPY